MVAYTFDALTLLVSLSLKFVGFPAQLRNGQTALPFAVAMLVSYALWVAQGLIAGDWVVVISQGAGVVLTALLVAQSLRRHNSKVPSSSQVQDAGFSTR